MLAVDSCLVRSCSVWFGRIVYTSQFQLIVMRVPPTRLLLQSIGALLLLLPMPSTYFPGILVNSNSLYTLIISECKDYYFNNSDFYKPAQAMGYAAKRCFTYNTFAFWLAISRTPVSSSTLTPVSASQCVKTLV